MFGHPAPWLAAAVWIAAFAGSSTESAQSSDVAAVLKLEHAWLDAASIHRDPKMLDRILAPGFVDTAFDGRIRSKSDALKAAAEPKVSHQSLSELVVHLFGDTAVVTGINDVTGASASGPWHVRIRFTDVFQKDGQTWRAIAAQENVLD